MPKKIAAKPIAKLNAKPKKKINIKVEKENKIATTSVKAVAKLSVKLAAKAVKAATSDAEAQPKLKKVRIPIPPGLSGEAQKLALKWRQLFEKSQSQEPSIYKMSGQYPAKTPIKHKVLGWGYVLSSNNNRIEVLFQDGVKTLITDFKE